MKKYRQGLFFFADTLGLPLPDSVAHLKSKGLIDNAQEFLLLCEYVADACKAGWSNAKIRSELREAKGCGVNVPDMLLKEWKP